MQHLLLVPSWGETIIFNVLRVVWISGNSINYHSVSLGIQDKLLRHSYSLVIIFPSHPLFAAASKWEIISVHGCMLSPPQYYAR